MKSNQNHMWAIKCGKKYLKDYDEYTASPNRAFRFESREGAREDIRYGINVMGMEKGKEKAVKIVKSGNKWVECR